uniref:Reverse transcriptase domain-containing protein n=1 Tax=Tanacetum cinerariifolium TaxID=118510 RepID=A0A6L2LE33_TANCI|nr:reverse transcriptase domain-containing protein [Tanacetum cinerariifolium]
MANADNANRNPEPREAPVERKCSYKEFMSCQSFNFKGSEGAIRLIRWFERTKSLFSRSNCTEEYKKYCPWTEIKKKEDKFYHLTVKGNDPKTYRKRALYKSVPKDQHQCPGESLLAKGYECSSGPERSHGIIMENSIIMENTIIIEIIIIMKNSIIVENSIIMENSIITYLNLIETGAFTRRYTGSHYPKTYWASLLKDILGALPKDILGALPEDILGVITQRHNGSISRRHNGLPSKETTKYKKKTDEPVTSPRSKSASASKGTRLKSKAKMYEDVNVNLEKNDDEMIDANQGGSEQQNVSQESRFKQEEEDAHVTLTSVSDAQKADEPV